MDTADKQSTKHTLCGTSVPLLYPNPLEKSPLIYANKPPPPFLTHGFLLFDKHTTPPHPENLLQDVIHCGQQALCHGDAMRNAHIHTGFIDPQVTIEHNMPTEDEHLPTSVGATNGLIHNLQLDKLPGFRFHPTEHELVGFYLRRKVEGTLPVCNIIPDTDFYNYHPWELCEGMEKSLQREWFFFVLRDSKYPHGGRPNRRTKYGFWKATGVDKIVKVDSKEYTKSLTFSNHCYGLRKILVYYKGRAPRGLRSHWIMNEYRLSYGGDGDYNTSQNVLQRSITLCKVYKKKTTSVQNKVREIESSNVEDHGDKFDDENHDCVQNNDFDSHSFNHNTQAKRTNNKGWSFQVFSKGH